jgi:transposase InsO family protein
MPFKETCPVEERIAMLRDFDTGVFSATEVARRHNVSRETFYVWKARRDAGGPRWFDDQSCAPGTLPHATTDAQALMIVETRRRFPHFGPKKVKAWLQSAHPDTCWPAASTVGDILKRAGLVEARKIRRRAIAQGEVVHPAGKPNEEWAIDFKGWFRTIDGQRVDPLTLTDSASRYLIELRIVEPTWAGVRGALERVFAEHGLPGAIRSDNGSPFGSSGAGGLSSLSAWWLTLGIEPRYIPPSSPQDNGRHERMHRTLKAETSKPPSASAREQQARFDEFRRHFNEVRPHESLAQTPPAKHWQASTRCLPKCIAPPWYDADHETRVVRSSGDIKWRGQHIFIGEALAGQTVGLTELEAGHLVRFCTRDLGIIAPGCRFHRFAPPRARLRVAVEPAPGTNLE